MYSEIIQKTIDNLTQRRKTEQTIQRYLQLEMEYIKFCKKDGLEINSDSARQFLEWKRSKGYQYNTLTFYFYVLKRILAIKENRKIGEIEIDFELPKQKRREQPLFTWEVIKYMINISKFKGKHHAFLRILTATMARRSEVLNLEKSDLRMEQSTFLNNEGKLEPFNAYLINFRPEISKSEGRILVVDKITWEVAKNLNSDSEKVFGFSRQMANKIIRKYKPIEIRGGCHAIRRGIVTYIRQLLVKESDRDILRYYSGWRTKSQDIMNIYARIDYGTMWRWYQLYHPLVHYGTELG